MDWALDIASWILLLMGSFFAIVGGIGLLRLPDFYARVHAGGVTDTLGAGLVLAGVILQAGDWLAAFELLPAFLARVRDGGIADGGPAVLALVQGSLGAVNGSVVFKLSMILFFLMLTSPTSAHALCKSAMAHGVQPLLAGEEEKPSPS